MGIGQKNKNKENIRYQMCRNNLKKYYKCGITIQNKCVLEVKRKLYREEICKRKNKNKKKPLVKSIISFYYQIALIS